MADGSQNYLNLNIPTPDDSPLSIRASRGGGVHTVVARMVSHQSTEMETKDTGPEPYLELVCSEDEDGNISKFVAAGDGTLKQHQVIIELEYDGQPRLFLPVLVDGSMIYLTVTLDQIAHLARMEAAKHADGSIPGLRFPERKPVEFYGLN